MVAGAGFEAVCQSVDSGPVVKPVPVAGLRLKNPRPTDVHRRGPAGRIKYVISQSFETSLPDNPLRGISPAQRAWALESERFAARQPILPECT